MVLLVVANPDPSVIMWGDGPDAIIYNEAYAALIGKKHPDLQGQDPTVGFAELWDRLCSSIAYGQNSGKTTCGERQLLLMKRYGFIEETYFNWNYIPVVGDGGFVVGIYVVCQDVTRDVLSQRRMATIRTLGTELSPVVCIQDVWSGILRGLESNPTDIPLALLYSVKRPASMTSTGNWESLSLNAVCILEGVLGAPKGHICAPAQVNLEVGTEGFVTSFRESMKGDKPLLITTADGTLPSSHLHDIEWRGFGLPCSAAIVWPIRSGQLQDPIAFLVLGLNPRRPYDESYQDFIHLIMKQITTPHIQTFLLTEEMSMERKYRQFADHALIGVCLLTPEGCLEFANEAWFTITSQSRLEVSPLAWKETTFHIDDLPRMTSLFENLAARKDTFTVESRLANKAGGEAWVLASAYAELHPTGVVKNVICWLTNITAQKAAEHLLRQKMDEALEMNGSRKTLLM